MINYDVGKLLNGFPVTSPAMIIAITKHKQSSETKVGKWRMGFLRSQLAKFTLISILRTFGKRQNGNQKAGPFESNTAKFSQSRRRSFK